MRIPFAFIARTGPLDHSRLKAQAARGHAFLAHLVQQSLTAAVWQLPLHFSQQPLAQPSFLQVPQVGQSVSSST